MLLKTVSQELFVVFLLLLLGAGILGSGSGRAEKPAAGVGGSRAETVGPS